MPIKQVFCCDFCAMEKGKCSAMLPNGWTKVQITVVDSSETEVKRKDKEGKDETVKVPKYSEATVLKYACPTCTLVVDPVRSAMDQLNGR